MGVCRDCEHWRNDVPVYGYCQLAESVDCNPRSETSKAYTMANKGGAAGLKTYASYGCNQFEERA